MNTGTKTGFPFADRRYILNGRYRLRLEIGWALLAAMVLCCMLLSIPHLPEDWRPLQNLAAVLQAFLTGLVAAQWLPIWEAKPPGGERVAPSTD